MPMTTRIVSGSVSERPSTLPTGAASAPAMTIAAKLASAPSAIWLPNIRGRSSPVVASATSALPEDATMIPPKPVSAAPTNSATSAVCVRIAMTPSPVTQPPMRIAFRRGMRRGRSAAGSAPASAPRACAPPSTPIARASKPSER